MDIHIILNLFISPFENSGLLWLETCLRIVRQSQTALFLGKDNRTERFLGLRSIHKRLNKGTPKENISNELKVLISLPNI